MTEWDDAFDSEGDLDAGDAVEDGPHLMGHRGSVLIIRSHLLAYEAAPHSRTRASCPTGAGA